MKFDFTHIVFISFNQRSYRKGMDRICNNPKKSSPDVMVFNLNAMTQEDLRAIYQFIRYLGPGGKPAPDYVPPGQKPIGSHAIFPEPPK